MDTKTKKSSLTNPYDAVGYAHSQEVLHGNINPMNIIITHEGLLKVKEFSFFNNLSLSTNVKALNFKQFRYIAPENFRSNQLLPESDVYSLAVILYEMLTGKVIYSSKDMNVLVQKILKGNFTPILELNPDIPKELALLVEKGLSIDPSERFENPIKFKYAIQKYLIQGSKIFSSQHFYTLMSKLFTSQVSKELQQNSSYKDLKLDDFENHLKPIVKNNDPVDFVPSIDNDLFEGDDDATSILFDNIEDIESVDEIESFKPSVKANMYDDEDEKTMILDDDKDENNEEEELIVDNKQNDAINKQDEEYKKLLNDESTFSLKSFIIGVIIGVIAGASAVFVLLGK